jgi:hypothetical protein
MYAVRAAWSPSLRESLIAVDRVVDRRRRKVSKPLDRCARLWGKNKTNSPLKGAIRTNAVLKFKDLWPRFRLDFKKKLTEMIDRTILKMCRK